MKWTVGAGMLGPFVLAAWLPTASAEPRKASGSVTLSDAAGDVESMQSTSGKHPGRDVVELRLASDGQDLTVSATLADDASGTLASKVIELYVDTDGDGTTGKEATWGKKTGFELAVELTLCVKYTNGGEACMGSAGKQASGYYAVARVRDLVAGQSLGSVFSLPQTPVAGKVLTSRVTYADLGLKPGQTVRLYARESSGPYDPSSYFPEVALTLE